MNYIDYQKSSIKGFRDYSLWNIDEGLDGFKKLFSLSKPNKISIDELTIDLTIEYDCESEYTFITPFDTSYLFISGATNYSNAIFYLLESIIKYKKAYFECDEEGPDSFIYVERINNSDIRVIHLSERVQIPVAIKYDNLFKIRQDFIINKKDFINKIYKITMQKIKDFSTEDEFFDVIEAYQDFIKGSKIVEDYLNTSESNLN